MKPQTSTIIIGIAAAVLLLIGFTIAWGIYRPKPAPPETAAPQVRQKDGSLELQRAAGPGTIKEFPGSLNTTPTLKPAGIIPKGAKVLRNIEVTVDPVNPPTGSPARGSQIPAGGRSFDLKPPGDAPGSPRTASALPVTIDLSLIRLKDKTERVIASSPNGTVVGGIDVPVETPPSFKVQRWTASALAGYDSHIARNVFGGEVGYTRGPFVVSGGIIGGTAFVGGGIKF